MYTEEEWKRQWAALEEKHRRDREERPLLLRCAWAVVFLFYSLIFQLFILGAVLLVKFVVGGVFDLWSWFWGLFGAHV